MKGHPWRVPLARKIGGQVQDLRPWAVDTVGVQFAAQRNTVAETY
jgi:hypothetical protein